MIKNKKGIQIGWEFIAITILVLACAIGLFIFVTKFIYTTTSNVDRDVCKATVQAQSAIMKLKDDSVEPDCKTFNVRFYEDHVERNGKVLPVYDPDQKRMMKEFDSLNNNVVNSVVAEELRWCWWQFLEGKKSILGASWLFPSGSYESCFICSEVSFDGSVKKSSFSGFLEYTKQTQMPNSDKTYYQYYAESPRLTSYLYDRANSWEDYSQGKIVGGQGFTCTWHSAMPLRPAININLEMKKDQTYAVFFVKEGESYKWDAKKDPTDPCSLETYFSYIIPVEDLAKQCDSVKRGTIK